VSDISDGEVLFFGRSCSVSVLQKNSSVPRRCNIRNDNLQFLEFEIQYFVWKKFSNNADVEPKENRTIMLKLLYCCTVGIEIQRKISNELVKKLSII